MTPTPILQQYIDSTMISTFRSCPRKFFHEYILGLRPADTSIHLHAGGVFSATLESFYREIYRNKADTALALTRAHKTFIDEWEDFPVPDKTTKTFSNMWAAVEDYVAKYPPATDPVQPFYLDGAPSFEFSFAIPLEFPGFPNHPISGDPFIYVGRFDMFGRYHGMPAVKDDKTAARLESNWAEKWDLRSQFLGYCWALQHSGIPCNTTVVRGVIIRAKDIAQVEAIKVYPQFLIDRWFEQLRRDLWRLRAAWDEQWFDYDLSDACTAYAHCPFMPLCSSPQPENWYSGYKEVRWNPLNRNPVSPVPSTVPLLFQEKLPNAYPN